MIVIKLWGGIGNQLFQYAFGFVLARLKREKLEFDLSFYENQPKYVGKRKHIDQAKFPNISIDNTFERNGLISLLDYRYVRQIIRRHNGLKLHTPKSYIVLEKCQKYYDEIPYTLNKLNYYIGYWQTAKYFERYRNEILRLFTPNQNILKSSLEWRNSLNSDCCVAVHIRRGDYVRKGNESITQGINYYLQAINYLKTQLPNPLFCVFSDDLDWCKNQFQNIENIVYVDNRREDGDLIDLFSMTLCDHGIMSNSTFSWWGNWLRKDNSNSIVIYPDGKYFNEYFMPESWYKITTLLTKD